jgi:hypothetical protein
LPHPLLHFQQFAVRCQVQRGQKPPQGALRRQPQYFQDAGQHRFPIQKAQMMQPRKPHVDSRHHSQHERIHAHGPRDSLHRQRLFYQLLKSQLFQHGGHR